MGGDKTMAEIKEREDGRKERKKEMGEEGTMTVKCLLFFFLSS